MFLWILLKCFSQEGDDFSQQEKFALGDEDFTEPDLVEHINDKHLQGAVTVLRADRKYERTENKGHI